MKILDKQILEAVLALPRQIQGAAWLAAVEQGAALEALGAIASRAIFREERSPGAAKLDDESCLLATQLVAPEPAEIERWRTVELDHKTETLCGSLRDGTCSLAENLRVTRRRAQQIVAKLVRDAERGAHQQELFGEVR